MICFLLLLKILELSVDNRDGLVNVWLGEVTDIRKECTGRKESAQKILRPRTAASHTPTHTDVYTKPGVHCCLALPRKNPVG